MKKQIIFALCLSSLFLGIENFSAHAQVHTNPLLLARSAPNPNPPQYQPKPQVQQKESIVLPQSVDRGNSFRVIYKGGYGTKVNDKIRIVWQGKTHPLVLQHKNGSVQGELVLTMPRNATQAQKITIHINDRQVQEVIHPTKNGKR